jgi:hypothetical protein
VRFHALSYFIVFVTVFAHIKEWHWFGNSSRGRRFRSRCVGATGRYNSRKRTGVAITTRLRFLPECLALVIYFLLTLARHVSRFVTLVRVLVLENSKVQGGHHVTCLYVRNKTHAPPLDTTISKPLVNSQNH